MSVKHCESTYIRNVAIIAHVDHGKSTLSDRLIQICKGMPLKQMRDQVLDSMDLERERGITIKAQSFSLQYSHENNTYQLNFIDTPGHADFAYEVSRALASCEAVLLLVDAAEGICAQTLEHLQVAVKYGLQIIAVINKIDLPGANIELRKAEINTLLKKHNKKPLILTCSAKKGQGIVEIIECIIHQVSPPCNNQSNNLRVRILDSWFDKYLGVISLIHVCEGVLRKHDKVQLSSTKKNYQVNHIGIFTPLIKHEQQLTSGQIGFVGLSVKNLQVCSVGDTIVSQRSNTPALPGFYRPKPRVFACIFPTSNKDFNRLKLALEKLLLNDASLYLQETNSSSLGSGFQCGFLGILHMDITRERLTREYEAQLIVTPPSSSYICKLKTGDQKLIYNAADLPSKHQIQCMEEAFSEVHISCPQEHVGALQNLCIEKRGVFLNLDIEETKAKMCFKMPFIEIIKDLDAQVKAITSGYGKINYHTPRYEFSEIVTLHIKVNDVTMDALSTFIHVSDGFREGSRIAKVLKSEMPRSWTATKIQAVLNGKVVAREDISALRKNVTAKCYGGDYSRKMKLLKKQKTGKQHRAKFSNVTIPKEVFTKLMQTN